MEKQNKFLVIFAIASVIFLMLSGVFCFVDSWLKSENTKQTTLGSYRPAINEWKEFFTVKKVGVSGTYVNELNEPGNYDLVYSLKDLNCDNIPELVIAYISKDGTETIVNQIFTLDGNKIVDIFGHYEKNGFWSRNRLQVAKDGYFVVTGSWGADGFVKTVYYLKANETIVSTIEKLGMNNEDRINGTGDAKWWDFKNNVPSTKEKFDILATKYGKELTFDWKMLEKGK